MSERYIKLYSLEDNLYSLGSPIIIAGGRLTKDTTSGKVFAQLKFRNISASIIKAVRISVNTYDVNGELIGDAISYEYTDLSISRDVEFGQKSAVIVNDAAVSFSVEIKEVAFDDDSVYVPTCEWEVMPEKQKLIEAFEGNSELVKEYQISFGKTCEFNPIDYKDLWICACGAENQNAEEYCNRCGAEYQLLKNLDIAELSARKDMRLAKEKKIREQQAAEAQKIAAKAKKTALYAIVFAVVFTVVLSIIRIYSDVLTTYKYALDVLYSEDVTVADCNSIIEVFESLGGFKDSKEQILEAKYIKATIYFDREDYEEASEAFSSIVEYKDSAAKKEQADLWIEVFELLETTSGKYGSRSDKTSSYYGFNKAAKLIKNFKGEKTDEMKKLYDDITLALKYYGKWKIKSGKLKAVGISNYYDDSVKKIAFNLVYDSTGVHLKMLPVQKGSEEKDGSFSYYSYETHLFKVSSEKKYKFECKGISYINSFSYIPAIKDNQFKIKLFENDVYTANIVLSR